jgi:muconolactone delta-isomerase
MRYLAVITRNVHKFAPEEFQAYLEPEAEHARRLHSQGVFRSIWTYADEAGKPKGAVIEIDGDTPDAVHNVLKTLPMAEVGMISWQLLPILPYRGFAPRNP